MKKTIMASLLAMVLVSSVAAAAPAEPVQSVVQQNTVDARVMAQPVISDGHYAADGAELTYPIISMANTKAQEKINREIQKDIQKLLGYVQECREDGTASSSGLKYEVTYLSAELLSIRMEQYFYMQGAAHPMSYDYGYVFRLSDGKALKLDELHKTSLLKDRAEHYKLPAVSRAVLKQTAQREIPLYAGFTGIKDAPEELYLDSEGHVHALFQRYDIAPYSSGLIDIDLDI